MMDRVFPKVTTGIFYGHFLLDSKRVEAKHGMPGDASVQIAKRCKTLALTLEASRASSGYRRAPACDVQGNGSDAFSAARSATAAFSLHERPVPDR